MGQPPTRHGVGSPAEYIGRRGDTGGSETSQYPEEKKSTETAQVVASERASAQTGAFTPRGCGTAAWYVEG